MSIPFSSKRNMQRRLFLCSVRVLLVLTALLFVSRTDGQQQAGFVLEMKGRWTAGTPETVLKLGQGVRAGAVLQNGDAHDGDRIVIADLHAEIIKTIACKGGVCRQCLPSGACYDPVEPLPQAASTGVVSAAFAAVVELFAEKPERYSVHRVRGAELDIAKCSVSPLDGTILDLDPLVKDNDEGAYLFEFTPLYEPIPNPTALSVQAERKPGLPFRLLIPGIRFGLYEVRVTHGASSATGWILLCAPENYRQKVMLFADFVRQEQGWSGKVSEETREASERAYLDSLSSSSTP